MKTKITAFLLLLSTTLFARHHIQYQISPLGNLIYQLDCITQPVIFPCSQADFSELWESGINSDKQDAAMLERWKSARTKLNKTIEYVELPELELLITPNFPMNSSNGINVLEQVRIMAFASEKRNHYLTQLKFWLPINAVKEEQQIIDHFWPRFAPWFEQQQATLNQFVDDAKILSEKHDVDGLLTAMQTFYQSDLPEDLVLPVYLVAHPKKSAATSGLVFNENSVVEVLNGEKASNRLAVVIHEIAHFYHERAPLDTHLNRMAYFFNENSEVGKIGYYLFNEAMATAIGNGLLEQRMMSPERFEYYQQHPMSFYNNQGIDQAAKTALRLVTQQIKNQQAIDMRFMAALDKTWAKGLHQIKNQPQQLLRHMGLLIMEETYTDMINEIIGTIRPSSAQINTNEDLNNGKKTVIEQYPQMDTVILAKNWTQIQAINIPEFELVNTPEKGIYVHSTTQGVYFVLIVEPDKSNVTEHIKQILAWSDFKSAPSISL
ncbi:MAG: hypothetical protein KDI92_00180 [Xanthomonadales bacterium]|nr:hypothetical protein [Xanthomonadales bacterium]